MTSHLPPLIRLFAAALSLAALLAAGCQQKMAGQPSYKPLASCEFFDDGSSARPLVSGTVPRGHLRTDIPLFTGRLAGHAGQSPGRLIAWENEDDFTREIPIPMDEATLEHGHDRYMIFCVVCHDPLGTGHGKIVERGYTRPPSYHIDRLRNAPAGRLFAVISEGYGSMPSYAAQIPPRDRWAIVAYLRALQLSQHYPVEELTPQMREEWQKAVRSEQHESATAAAGEEASP
jgi:mono/diheme cytochrome c family protein